MSLLLSMHYLRTIHLTIICYISSWIVLLFKRKIHQYQVSILTKPNVITNHPPGRLYPNNVEATGHYKHCDNSWYWILSSKQPPSVRLNSHFQHFLDLILRQLIIIIIDNLINLSWMRVNSPGLALRHLSNFQLLWRLFCATEILVHVYDWQ